MNKHFHEKVDRLRKEIKDIDDEEPAERLRKHLEDRNLHFELTEVTVQEVIGTIKKMKTSMATGMNGMPQQVMKYAAEIVAIPLQLIINRAITEGNTLPNGSRVY